MKESDQLIYAGQLNTHHHVLFVTTKGNIIYRPVHELTDKKWKDVGEHFSQTLSTLLPNEQILKVFPYETLDETKEFVFVTKEGMIKRTPMSEFSSWRTYRSRPLMCMKLKTDTDELISANLVSAQIEYEVTLISHLGFGLRYDLSEVPTVGAKASGVKAMNLKEGDYLVSSHIFPISTAEYLVTVVTQRGSVKKMDVLEISKLGRAKRGLMVLRELKNNPHRVFLAISTNGDNELIIIETKNGSSYTVDTKDIPINDRTSNGSFISNEKVDGEVIKLTVSQKEKED